MSSTCLRFSLLLALCAASTSVGLADELELVGRHHLSGRIGGRTFSGSLEVRADAGYSGERRFADGQVEALAGRVSFDERALVLTPAAGLTGALGGASATARRYARDDDGRTVRWTLRAGDDVETIRQPEEDETKLELVGRLLRRPVLRWLFKDNLGLVDDRDGAEILRSKQPTPNDLIRRQERDGVRTILSLNGDQDDTATLWEDTAPGESPRGRKVNLREFIAARGLNHEVLKMSASRAPSDAELVAAFRVLLDDSKRPVLIHCQGGSDRTGIISALYQVEFLGVSKAEAKKRMRKHLWMAHDGTEIQGAYLDLYQPGTIRRLLQAAGVEIPARYR